MPTSVDATASQAGGERVERPLRAAIAPAENAPSPLRHSRSAGDRGDQPCPGAGIGGGRRRSRPRQATRSDEKRRGFAWKGDENRRGASQNVYLIERQSIAPKMQSALLFAARLSQVAKRQSELPLPRAA